jgi:hypothetical protein
VGAGRSVAAIGPNGDRGVGLLAAAGVTAGSIRTTCGSSRPVSTAVFIATSSAARGRVRWANRISINARVPAASPRERRTAYQ